MLLEILHLYITTLQQKNFPVKMIDKREVKKSFFPLCMYNTGIIMKCERLTVFFLCVLKTYRSMNIDNVSNINYLGNLPGLRTMKKAKNKKPKTGIYSA